VFFYSRRVGLSMQNSGFERAAVHSQITFGAVPWLLSSLVP